MRLQNERGIALAITLLNITVLIVLGCLFILRSVNEKNIVDKERKTAQSFYLAEGGADAAIDKLNELINVDLLNTINSTNPQTVGNKAQQYVTTGDGLGFLIEYAKFGGAALFTLTGGTQAIFNGTSTALGSGTYQFKIIATEKTNPVSVGTDKWDFPYYFRIESTGTVGNMPGKVLYNGDFTVRVQRDNFAKFALFTDHHTLPSGTVVWFTDKTNFAGPIHTNDQYSFAKSPSGIFDGVVTQQNTKARFYNNGNAIQMNASTNPPYDVPTFNSTYTRGAAQIVLASSVQQQDLYNQARGPDNTNGNGIFVANNGSSLTGGIYVKGDSTIQMAVDASGNAKYTVSQGATTKNITVSIPSNQTTVQTVGGGTSTYTGLPNGVDKLGTIIYTDGTVNSVSGTIQKDTEVTVSSQFDIVVTDNLVYQNYTPAVGTPGSANYTPPNANDATNLLGLVAWGGNVRVGTGAPNDINVHAIVMARNGILQVDSYNNTNVGPRGVATLLGGAITQFYGAFGLFNGSTGAQTAGYGRNFVYDSRTLLGKSPPYFPSMNTFIAFTNDITDKIAWQENGF